MKITVITVGKLKERFFREAAAEYEKRLGRYCRLEIRETADEKTPDGASETERELILKKEGARVAKLLPDDAYVVTLEIEGRRFTSEAFAGEIERLGVSGIGHIVFEIGGTLGLHNSIKKRADPAVRFTDMTCPQQEVRGGLLEQIYMGVWV